MSATVRERALGAAAVLAVMAVLALLGGLFGLVTYALHEALTLDPSLPALVGLLVDLVTRAPSTAAYVGAATYVVGGAVVLWRHDALRWDDDSAFGFVLDLLGVGTFVGLLGVPTSMVVHAWRSASGTPDGALGLLAVVLAGLPTVAFDMLVVGFVSPILFVLLVLSVFASLLAAVWLAERRDSLPR